MSGIENNSCYCNKEGKRKDDSMNNDTKSAVSSAKKLDPNEIRTRFKGIMKKYHSDNEADKEEAQIEAISKLKGLIYATMNRSYPTYMREYFKELEQEGCIGILKGLQKYDPEKSMPSTWFFPYIQHEMQAFINEFVIKTTAHYSANLRKVEKAIKALDASGKQYSNVEIAIQTGLTLETVNQTMTIRNRKDEVHYDACPESYINSNADVLNTTPEEAYIASEELHILHDAIAKTLTDDERFVIEHIFAIGGCEQMSPKDIAHTKNLPIEKIKKIRVNAIRKLRNSNLKKTFPDYLASEERIIDECEIPLMPQCNNNMSTWLIAAEIDF